MRNPGLLVPALGMLLVVLASPARGADARTAAAIDAGIRYLLPATEQRLQAVEGGPAVPTQDGEIGPLTLQVYALVVAGVSVEHPTIQRSFRFLEKLDFKHTYTVALYAFALDAAISQIEDDLLMLEPPRVRARFRDNPAIGKEYRPRLKQSVEHFVRTQNKLGVWRYGPGAQDFDNSNVQFAVLALGVGAKRGVPMDPSVWIKVMDHFVKGQQAEGPETAERLTLKPLAERGIKREDIAITKTGGAAAKTTRSKKDKDGGKTGVITAPATEDPEVGTERLQVFQRGWDYLNSGKSNWNMTCAGLSSLLLARESLRSVLQPDQKKALDKAIWDGYGWVMANWAPNASYYGMYSLEKVGDIGEVVKFGGHDWYAEIESHLLGMQRPDGSWPNGSHKQEDAAVGTGYALLILNRATSLLAMDRMNKIVVSGRRDGGDGKVDRNWVYVRDIDTSLEVPTLMRAVRLRPTPKVLRFLEKVVAAYDENYLGELVPELVGVRDAVAGSKAALKLIDDLLQRITGYAYGSADDYMNWFKRWQRVVAIGESGDPARKDDLLQYYKSTSKSVPLKAKIMWALSACKVREAIPLFLADLNNSDPAIRREAYSNFKGFFIDFPPAFDHNAGEEARNRQIAAIQQWFAKQPQ